MARYPTPPSGNLSGQDGRIVRMGSGGHISLNVFSDKEGANDYDRHNCQDFDDADFGGIKYQIGDEY